MARIYKRGRIYYLDVTVNGARKRISIGPDRAEAERYKREAERERIRRKLDLAPASPVLLHSLNDYLDSFQHSSKPRSFEAIHNRLRHFTEWLKEKHREAELISEVTPRMIEDFKSFRLGQGAHPNTVTAELIALGTFWRWAGRLKMASSNPVAAVKKPKAYKREPRIFTPAELTFIFDNAGADSLFYRFLYKSGFRLREALDVRFGDIDMEKRLIRYHNLKMSRDEWVELPAVLVEEILRLKGKATDYLFHRQRERDQHSRSGLLRNFKLLLKRLKLPDGHLHNFKASLGTHLLDAGVDPRAVMVMMHHTDLSTTLGYTRRPKEIKGVVDKLPV